jgi:hypothetical protein
MLPSLKGNQDPSDLFEELVDIEHAYSETATTLGTQDLIVAVFGAAAEKYHTVINVTADTKVKSLDIGDLEKVMHNIWGQGGGAVLITRTLNWSWEPLQAPVVCAKIKATMKITAQARIVVVEEATKEMESKMEARRSLWELAIIMASLAT